jgi:hypothetical protein
MAEVQVDKEWLATQPVSLSCTVCREELYVYSGGKDGLTGLEATGKTPHKVRSEDAGHFSTPVPDVPAFQEGFELRCMATPDCRGHADLTPLVRLREMFDPSSVAA